MTIAVVWQEDDRQWCVADTLLTFEPNDQIRIDVASKIFSIPVMAQAIDEEDQARQSHYWTQYGFVYSGATLTASLTAVTASTLLQQLVCPGGRADPPTFEQIAELVNRLAGRFMVKRGQFGEEADGAFEAALFGWCIYDAIFKVAHIKYVNDCAGFRVEMCYPPAPKDDGEPWLLLGSGAETFSSTLATYKENDKNIKKRIPRHVIKRMVAERLHPAVGGSTSIGFAHRNGFEICYSGEPIEPGEPGACRMFGGLDLDKDIGTVGRYTIGHIGIG